MQNEIEILKCCAWKATADVDKYLFKSGDYMLILLDRNRNVLEVITGNKSSFARELLINKNTVFDDEMLNKHHEHILTYKESIFNKKENSEIGYIYLIVPKKDLSKQELADKTSMLANLIASAFDIKLSESYKETILNSILDGIISVDEEGIITNINESMIKMLELDTDNLIGKNIQQVFGHDQGFVKIFSPREKLITDQQIYVNLPKSKTLKSFSISSHCISLKNIGFEGRVIVMNDEKRTRRVIQQRAGLSARYSFDDIITHNPLFQEIIELAKTAAISDANVLLLGESGTGKEMFAQAIHNYSKRKKNPFVAINCAAIPKDLIESELFGYVEGAFTGAQKGGSFGKFDLANEGTLFLDEIGDMPLELQGVLLRAIEEKSIMRIGGKTKIPVDIRFIAATNKDLKKNIREDLFYRLAVFTINIFPLRNRKDDIIHFTKHFIEKFAHLYKKNIQIDPQIFDVLVNYDWPGNVRELQNIIERICAVVEDQGIITVDILPQEIWNIAKNNSSKTLFTHKSPLNTFQKKEREIIKQLLQSTNGNISMVAKELGLARSTIYRKINKYSLNRYQ